MENNYTRTTTADTNLDMMSLYDYLGRPAGSNLGRAVFETSKKEKILVQEKHVTNKKYTGKILMYPKYFLDNYFKNTKQENKLPF